jgi:hypothetical protein
LHQSGAAKYFLKIFGLDPKVLRDPSDNPSRYPGMGLEKFFAKALKFPKSLPITVSDDPDWIKKKFVETLKFGKNGPITSQ